MFKHTSKVLFMLLLIPLLVAACGAKTPGQTPLPAATSSAKQPPAGLPAPTSSGESALPAVNNGEGGGGEAASGPSLTNPGGLPAAPSSNDNSQSGQERMVKTENPAGLFSILFVDTWTQASGSTPGSLRSSQQKDRYAEAEVITAQGQTPIQAAQALDASHANGAAGYQKLVIQNGNVHGLPAASLVYQYETGTNPVTGKALKFIASQIFIGGGQADKLGHVTFSAPYIYYGDLSGIFDNILTGFAWK